MSAIEVRIIGSDDLDLLLSAGTDVFDNPVAPDLAKAFLARDDYVMALALEGSKVVGMASGFVYFHPDKAFEFFINEVGVAETHRRRGIAKKLMVPLFDWAKSKGCSYAWLGTELDNDAANALYLSRGGRCSQINFFEFDLAPRGQD